MPLLAILAAGMLSHALSGRFEWFYPLRLFACLTVIAIYRHRLAALGGARVGAGRCSASAFSRFGLLQYIFSCRTPACLGRSRPPRHCYGWSWIVCRVASTVLTVPLAEELAYRGFLMRRLQSRDFDSLAYVRVGWLALTASSMVFGAAHGALWLPGIVAGFAYGWLVKRQGQLGEAVLAHMTTNALVAAVALGTGNWAGF